MTLREVVEKIWLPQSLEMGVDYTLFWTLNPHKLKPFIEAYKKKIKARNDELNLFAWLNGIYNERAISAVLSEGKVKYYDKPIESHKDEANEMKTAAQKFEAYAIVFNKRKFGDCGG